MASSFVNAHCRPGEGGELTLWRIGVTNTNTVVDLTIDPALSGVTATAFTDSSGDDQGRIDISIPTDAPAGAYQWIAEIDSSEVFRGTIYIASHGRPSSFLASSIDIRTLTTPAWIIPRPEDVEGEQLGGGPATQIQEASGPDILDILGIADGEYLQRVGDDIVGATPSGSGDVTAVSNFGADNRIVRSDGITKGVQVSTASISDAGNLSGIVDATITGNLVMSASKTVDGRDVSADGTTLDGLVTASANTVTATSTFAADNRVLRSDGTGRGSQASTMTLSDTGAVGGVTDLTVTGDISMSVGKLIDGRDVSVDGGVLDTLSGSAVTAASTFGTDNRLLRADGTSRGAQASTAALTDAGALSGITDLSLTGDISMASGKTVDGRDVSADWTTSSTHFADTANPHDTAFTQLIDAPTSFTGEAGKFVRVKVSEDGLEFTSSGGSGATAFTDLTDVPASYVGEGTKLVAVKAAEDGLEFIVAPSGLGDVVGPSGATDKAFARFDMATGKLLQDGPVTCSDTGVIAGVDDFTLTGSITMSASETVDGRDVSADGTTLDGLAATSVSAASAFATDNRVLRSDGTGRGSQASTISVTDAGATTGIADLTITGDLAMTAGKTVDGRDVSVDGAALDGLVSASANYVSATSTFAADERLLRSDGTSRNAQASTIVVTDAGAVSGITSISMTGDITMGASRTVDGRDVSADGSALDALVTASTSYVSAASTFGTDNRMLRSDGTGRGSQASVITVSDTGAISGVTDLTLTGDITMSASKTVDGRDISADGSTLDGLVSAAATTVSAAATFDNDERLLRVDGTSRGAQASSVVLSDAGALSGVTSLTLTENIVMSASKTVDGRDVSVDGSTLDTLNSTAVVAAATFATDERLLRSDGTSRGAQASTIAVTDAGAVSGISSLTLTDNIVMSASKTVDGRDVSADGSTLDSHVANTSNPHSVTAAQAGAIATSAKGAASGVASLDSNTRLVEAAQVLRVTGQDLTIGAVNDGEVLTRSGTTIIGSAATGLTQAQVLARIG